ncbi:MAG TPA: hypothetical protein ENI20_09810 [Bacteroides sp.]|nr:hypothetical protein [Bacteroides sp.]
MSLVYCQIQILTFVVLQIRNYLNTRLDLSRHIDNWFKYALSWYPDRESISSGLNEIQGHHRQDINVQMRLRF